MKALKVLSYNIHKGFNTSGRQFVLNEIKAAIDRLRPDLIFLQEAVGGHLEHQKTIKGWPKESQADFIAAKICDHRAYGKNAVHSHGDHGNAILSRHKIVSFGNLDLSTNRFESRGMLYAVVEIPGFSEPLYAMSVHLDLSSRGRRIQLEKIASWMKANIPKSASVLLAGDFNDWLEAASTFLEKEGELQEALFKKQGSHGATFPSFFPLLRLDRIYCRGLEIRSARVLRGSPWRWLSDHLPVSARFLPADRVAQ